MPEDDKKMVPVGALMKEKEKWEKRVSTLNEEVEKC